MPVDDQQGGASTIPRRDPGWYDDPWNATQIRRWDGAEWTGETAPKPVTPPNAPLASAPSSPSSPSSNAPSPAGFTSDAPPRRNGAPASARSRRRVNPLFVAGAVAAVAVVGVVVALSGHSSSSSSTATTEAPPASTPTTGAPAGLASSVLVPADLGTGWTAIESRPLTPAEFTLGPCANPAWAHNVAGYLSSFVKGASAATAHGSVIAKVVEAPSLTVADDQHLAVQAPAYGACLQQRVVAEVRSTLPAGSSEVVSGATTTPFAVQLPIPSQAFVVSVVVSRPGAAPRVVTVNAVAMFVGRYSATVEVSWSSDAPLGGQIVQQQAAYEAAHLTALAGRV